MVGNTKAGFQKIQEFKSYQSLNKRYLLNQNSFKAFQMCIFGSPPKYWT
jgi:hypothetical protein